MGLSWTNKRTVKIRNCRKLKNQPRGQQLRVAITKKLQTTFLSCCCLLPCCALSPFCHHDEKQRRTAAACSSRASSRVGNHQPTCHNSSPFSSTYSSHEDASCLALVRSFFLMNLLRLDFVTQTCLRKRSPLLDVLGCYRRT